MVGDLDQLRIISEYDAIFPPRGQAELLQRIAQLEAELEKVKQQRDNIYDDYGMVLHRLGDSPGESAAAVLEGHYQAQYQAWLEVTRRFDELTERNYATHLRAVLDERTTAEVERYDLRQDGITQVGPLGQRVVFGCTTGEVHGDD